MISHAFFVNQCELIFSLAVCKSSLNYSCSALEPSSLAKAIYPLLISYSSPNKQAFPRHTLSRAALTMSESPIFLLDSFTNLIGYYSSTADPSLPFPPPHDCKCTTLLQLVGHMHFLFCLFVSAAYFVGN